MSECIAAVGAMLALIIMLVGFEYYVWNKHHSNPNNTQQFGCTFCKWRYSTQAEADNCRFLDEINLH